MSSMTSRQVDGEQQGKRDDNENWIAKRKMNGKREHIMNGN